MSSRILQVLLVLLLLLFNISDLIGTEKTERFEKWLIRKCRILSAKIPATLKELFTVLKPKELMGLLLAEDDEGGVFTITSAFIFLLVLCGIIVLFGGIISGKWDEIWTYLGTLALGFVVFLAVVLTSLLTLALMLAMVVAVPIVGLAAGLLLMTPIVLFNRFGEFTGQPSIFRIGKYIVTSGFLIWSLIK